MSLCKFSHAELESGGYEAICAVCGRFAYVKAIPVYAACKASADYAETHAQLAGNNPGGPGTELKAILSGWLGIEADSGCGCEFMAGKMDSLGPDWCESDAGLAEILATMRDEHAKRWADGRTKLPWTDFGATQLVRLACRRARAKAAS